MPSKSKKTTPKSGSPDISKMNPDEISRLSHELAGKTAHAEAYTLSIIGDKIAKREGYSSLKYGIEAVQYFLMQKHNWTPNEVLRMSHSELEFAISEEKF